MQCKRNGERCWRCFLAPRWLVWPYWRSRFCSRRYGLGRLISFAGRSLRSEAPAFFVLACRLVETYPRNAATTFGKEIADAGEVTGYSGDASRARVRRVPRDRL